MVCFGISPEPLYLFFSFFKATVFVFNIHDPESEIHLQICGEFSIRRVVTALNSTDHIQNDFNTFEIF